MAHRDRIRRRVAEYASETAGLADDGGEIDPRGVAKTNKPPELTAEQASAHTWKPKARTWDIIKKHSVAQAASITGLRGSRPVNVAAEGLLHQCPAFRRPLHGKEVAVTQR